MTDEVARLRRGMAASNDMICQSLGAALGYPRFVDDQKNFPGAVEADGVCVGAHVAESIAEEAASALIRMRTALKHYAHHYCEGWCLEAGGRFHDCGGCEARAALGAP